MARQRAMDWYSSQRYAFDIIEVSHGDADVVEDVLNESRLTLNAVRLGGLKGFNYTGDFGDNRELVIYRGNCCGYPRQGISGLRRRRAERSAFGLR